MVMYAKIRRMSIREKQSVSAIARKNWLFSDTVAGANASANLYLLLQTCKVNGINSYRYLQALLVALPLAQTADDYEALLPWNIVLPPG